LQNKSCTFFDCGVDLRDTVAAARGVSEGLLFFDDGNVMMLW